MYCLGDQVSETLPSGSVRDHRVECLAGLPRADQRRVQLGECPERLADRGRLVAELRLADARGFAIRSADDPVVGLHHRVGDERLPLDGADREDREAAVVRELAQPVGEVALPLPAQPRDAMRRDIVEEAFRNREAAAGARGGPAAGWRRPSCCPARTANRVTPASTVSSSSCSRSPRSPGGTRSAMRASIRRSASTSASAQSRSIVVVAGRMVRVRRQASMNLRTRSSFDCACGASSWSSSTSSREAPPEKDRDRGAGRQPRSGCEPSARTVGGRQRPGRSHRIHGGPRRRSAGRRAGDRRQRVAGGNRRRDEAGQRCRAGGTGARGRLRAACAGPAPRRQGRQPGQGGAARHGSARRPPQGRDLHRITHHAGLPAQAPARSDGTGGRRDHALPRSERLRPGAQRAGRLAGGGGTRRRFERWFGGPATAALEVPPAEVAAYLAGRAERSKLATVRSAPPAIAAACRAAGPDPTKTPLVAHAPPASPASTPGSPGTAPRHARAMTYDQARELDARRPRPPPARPRARVRGDGRGARSSTARSSGCCSAGGCGAPKPRALVWADVAPTDRDEQFRVRASKAKPGRRARRLSAVEPADTDRVIPISPYRINERLQGLAAHAGLAGVSSHSGRRGPAAELRTAGRIGAQSMATAPEQDQIRYPSRRGSLGAIVARGRDPRRAFTCCRRDTRTSPDASKPQEAVPVGERTGFHPMRQQNRRAAYREYWWRHLGAAPGACDGRSTA